MTEPISKENNSTWGQGLGSLIVVGLIVFLLIPYLVRDSSHVKRDKSPEPRYEVGAMNRAQQGYWLDHNTFAESVEALQLGISPQTQNYRYSTQILDHAAFQYGISLHPQAFKRKTGNILGIFPRRGKEYALPSYLGVVWFKPNPNADSDETQSDLRFFSIVCESTYPYLLEEGFQPSSHNGDFQCPEGMVQMN